MKILCLMISVVNKKYKILNLFIIFLSFCLAFSLFFGCQKNDEFVHLSGQTMGTTYNVKFQRSSKLKASNKEIKNSIDKRLKEINLMMSTFLPQSELSKFNKSKANKWVKISKNFSEVLAFSLSLARSTKGLYDPTVGPLVNIWGFGPTKVIAFPDKYSIKEALKAVGYGKLKFKKESIDNIESFKILKIVNELYLDLSSSAKGFGVDKIGKLLESFNIDNYLVEIGGELVTKGKKLGKFWKVGIEFPNNLNPEKSIIKLIDSKDYGIATSGNYKNFFKKNGKMFSHIISTKTGRPVFNSLLSVTVVTKGSCMIADGTATALMVMGRTKALKYANAHNIAAFLIYNNSKKSSVLSTHYTQAFKRLGL